MRWMDRGGRNQYLDRAGQQLTQPPQQPRLWGQAERTIQGRLTPGYSAFSPRESDAMFQSMQRRINEAFDQQRTSLAESLNQRGLYRTGLFDQLQHQFVEDPRQRALAQAATDVYLAGQDATRQDINNALAMALGLGGQQAGLQQQYLANLMGMSQLQQQADLLPLQVGQSLWGLMYGPERAQAAQATQGAYNALGTALGFILPKLFGLW